MTEVPREAIQRRLVELEAGFSGRLAVALKDFDETLAVRHNATESMPSASLIKLPILTFALKQVARGELLLDQRVPLNRGDIVGGSGVLQLLQPGLSPTVMDLMTLMIVVSDNTATNTLIDLLGLEPVAAHIHELGLDQTRLVGKLQLTSDRLNEAQRRGERNRTCASDMLTLLLKLERGEVLPERQTILARKILLAQQQTEALARFLPRDPELHPKPVKVASKSGCIRGVWHDAGIVYDTDEHPLYALVVMTADSGDRSYGWDQEGMMVIASLSLSIFEQLTAARGVA